MATRVMDSWSLISFARSHGQLKLGQFEKDGNTFASLIFINPSNQDKTFVGFSSKLGELSPREIASRKDELQVVMLDSGNYYLCKVGQNNWLDVDLGI